MEQRWDVIIVGARCAGATLATLLSRRGLRILLLEASSRGSNMPMSTHLVHPPGIDVLHAEQQRAVFPRAEVSRLEGLGHWPFLDDPAAVRAVVVPFLRRQLALGQASASALSA